MLVPVDLNPNPPKCAFHMLSDIRITYLPWSVIEEFNVHIKVGVRLVISTQGYTAPIQSSSIRDPDKSHVQVRHRRSSNPKPSSFPITLATVGTHIGSVIAGALGTDRPLLQDRPRAALHFYLPASTDHDQPGIPGLRLHVDFYPCWKSQHLIIRRGKGKTYRVTGFRLRILGKPRIRPCPQPEKRLKTRDIAISYTGALY